MRLWQKHMGQRFAHDAVLLMSISIQKQAGRLKPKTELYLPRLSLTQPGHGLTNYEALTGRKANQQSIRLVRGSHILTKRLFDHDKAYIFQNSDGRILFAIPYLDEFTLLGTTDVDHENTPDKPEISNDEISYICREVSAYLKQAVTPSDVVATYSGVRPLYDDGAEDAKAATRDYVLKFEEGLDGDWLNIFGGKLTTYRQLGLSVARLIEQKIAPPSAQIAGTSPLPGGDIEQANFDRFWQSCCANFQIRMQSRSNAWQWPMAQNLYYSGHCG